MGIYSFMGLHALYPTGYFIYFETADDHENINNLAESTYLCRRIAICIQFSCCVNTVPYQR